ncbi:ANGPTL1 [Branchiostoma lanceolatum]|uniref:ANGPTL1 protein n=1 Tax=Branchiostoma lanceolatum TaxID=7740 RepID=A0A8K0EEM1_BRALA|nr:ANGPTL1 [Branchiostoma lanceolatum]
MSPRKLFENGEAAPEASVGCHGNQLSVGISMALSGLAAVVIFVTLLFMAQELPSTREEQIVIQTDLNPESPTSKADINHCGGGALGGGLTVIQRRQDGSVPFNRNWDEYKQGFGNKSGGYWLGNENFYLLTSRKNFNLRIDFEHWNGEKHFTEYSTFRVSGESDGYRLHLSGFPSGADSMDYSNGQRFSTVDRDNDDQSRGYPCAKLFGQGGWWFGSCGHAYLNGRYLGNCGNSCPYGQGVMWARWRGQYYSLKSVSIKIRPSLSPP